MIISENPTPAAGGGGGSTFATDDFNRANGDLDGDTASGGGTWDDPCNGDCADFIITSNVLGSNNASDWNAYTHSATPPSADYYSEGLVANGTAINGMGPAVQVLDNNNYVGCYWAGGANWRIIKFVGGSGPTTIANGVGTNPPDPTPRTVRLTRSGTTYTCTSDGTQVAQGTDSSFSNAEKAGIMSAYTGTAATFDDYEAGQ